jgi:four helix bundle protein
MDYQEWIQSVPVTITKDSLWKVEVYRLALFAADSGWQDVVALARDRRMLGLAVQLNRALGSISANIAEGYSRSSVEDRARFYEYALGSARESRDWYYKARHVLGEATTGNRLELLTKVIRLLLVIIPHQRGSVVRENTEEYRDNEEPFTLPSTQHEPRNT